MPFIRQPFVRYSLLVGFICLTGCSNNPVIKTPVGWYHDLEGGIVSQPRLPVPGNDQSYPYVGLTPTHGPVLPSQDLRNQITESLLKDRTLSDWQNTVASFEIPKIPEPPQQDAKDGLITQSQPKPNEDAAKTNKDSQENSANFDAAGQTPPPIIINQPPAQPPKTEAVKPPAQPPKTEAVKPPTQPPKTEAVKPPAQPPKTDKKPEEIKKTPPEPVVMPELRTQIDNQTIVLPEIPVSPPKPSKFPGFNIPSDANLPPPFQPSSLPLEAPKGELITFPIDSDTPNPKQEGIINSLAWQRHDRTMFVHGYGNASSISPEAQSKALSLALLRAKTVAKMLIAHNVPESSIVIRAHAIGHGVRVRMDE